MTTPNKTVAQHYTVSKLEDLILAALVADGKDLDALSVADLAPIDAFHVRGRMATEELVQWARIHASDLLLDVGCALGGTSRYLAATLGCSVVGLDLMEEFCRIATMLSVRVGLADKTEFQQGSALALPFADAHFDVVWTEHVQMNIADKRSFYREIARVLKPGGQFAFHDIFAGDEVELQFPVPWAGDASISHLISVPDLQALLADSGLERVRWEDKTEVSMAFFHELLERKRREGNSALGMNLLMGESAPEKFSNLLRNFEEGHLRVLQAVMKRAD